MQALFGSKANLVNRSTINIFTTNYDTLLEDSLGLIRKNPVDGFEGGAIAYWIGNAAFSKTDINDVLVCKLHGSIDWTMNRDGNLYRTRYGTKYTLSKRDVLIYPRATKYVETQKDPFASNFAVFRSKLNAQRDNVLITCGYSFGDDHINGEIDLAMSTTNNKTVLLAFSKTDQQGNINEVLNKWLKSEFGERVYVMTDKGIHKGEVFVEKISPDPLPWWSFEGITKFIEDGEL